MNKRMNWPFMSVCFGLCLVFALLSAFPSLASSAVADLRVVKVSSTSIKVKWKRIAWSHSLYIDVAPSGGARTRVGTTTGSSWKISGLRPDTSYRIYVGTHNGYSRVSARTAAGSGAPGSEAAGSGAAGPGITQRIRPLPVTCPHLPPRVTVNGYTQYTQCRVVDQDAIGRMDVIEHGTVAAVDVWGGVPAGVEVCFRNVGSLVFLDAAYAPRKLVPLLSFELSGMTCGRIDRPGTVVLLRGPMTFDQPIIPADPAPSPPAETSSSAIPLDNCLIKLVETLFLRAEPAGEIIGLVWLNSEVPAYEINGDWYKIEFEGVTGYISRFYRKVLRGSCG